MSKERIGFIGLGKIGFPVALNMAKHGFPLVGFDPNVRPAYAASLHEAGGKVVSTLAELVSSSDIIVTLLPDSALVEQVLLNEEVFGRLGSGHLCIDMSSGYPAHTRRIGEALAAKGVTLIDAPICNGGVPGAYAGAITLCVGGEDRAIERGRPVLEACATNIQVVGGIGAGHTVKLVSNYLTLITPVLVSEALALGAAGGVAANELSAVLQHCAGSNFLRLDRVLPVLAGEPGDDEEVSFRLALARKDIRYATTLAGEANVPLLLCSAAHELLLLVERSGFEDAEAMRAPWDFLRRITNAPALTAIPGQEIVREVGVTPAPAPAPAT